MSLDKIVVLIMAFMFFGGLAYVIWKGRQQEKKETPAVSSIAPTPEQANAPQKYREKARKTAQK